MPHYQTLSLLLHLSFGLSLDSLQKEKKSRVVTKYYQLQSLSTTISESNWWVFKGIEKAYLSIVF